MIGEVETGPPESVPWRQYAVEITEPSGAFSPNGPLVKRVTMRRFATQEEAEAEAEWLRTVRYQDVANWAEEEDVSRSNEWHLTLARLERSTYTVVWRLVSGFEPVPPASEEEPETAG